MAKITNDTRYPAPASLDGTEQLVAVKSAAVKKPLLSAVLAWIKTQLNKADVGLGNADNTADASKPVSTLQAAADAAVLAAAIQRGNHTGTQSADTLTDGATNKAFLATERTKLSGIATAATANATDAQLRDRTTHTGAQAQSTVTNLVTDLAAKAAHATTISAAGLATGGGDLSANRTITVPVASQGEAEAGSDNTKAMTPLRTAEAIAEQAPPTHYPVADTAARLALTGLKNGDTAVQADTSATYLVVDSTDIGTEAGWRVIVNPASPGPIGGTTPASATFTSISCDGGFFDGNGIETSGFVSCGSLSVGLFGVYCEGTMQVMDTITTTVGFRATGGGLSILAGTGCKVGSFTLSSGAATVSNTSITANSIVFFTCTTASGTLGMSPRVSSISAGTSFNVTAAITDNSTYHYMIVDKL